MNDDFIPEPIEITGETFVCLECGHKLPKGYEHTEKPNVCYLDFVSQSDHEEIERAVEEAYANYERTTATANL